MFLSLIQHTPPRLRRLTPAAQRCSDELFTGLVALSEKHGLPRHTHVLETKQQMKLSQEKHHETAVQHLHKCAALFCALGAR